MVWEKVFLADGWPRPLWRFFLSVAMVVLAYSCAGFAQGFLFGTLGYHPGILVTLFWGNFLLLLALLGIFKILTATLEQKPLVSIGLAFHSRWIMESGIGLGIGASMILLVAGAEHLLGVLSFSRNNLAPSQVLTGGAFLFVVLVVAATNEEMMFRGYPFQRLVEAIGPVGAVVASSAAFGLVHLANPHHTWVSTLNTMLVGVPLAVAYLRTRELWLSIALHFGWNFFQGYGLGLPVSGIVLPAMVFKPEVREVAWLTGGNYGPEGSVLATGAIVLATLYLLFSPGIYITRETRRLVFGKSRARAAG